MVRNNIKIRFGIKMPKGIDWRRMCGPRVIHQSDKGLIVRLVNNGCSNRPFYHINVEHVSRMTISKDIFRHNTQFYFYMLCIQIICVCLFVKLQYRLKPNKEIPAVEKLGSYDPLVNAYGEKLVAINLDRMAHYIGRGIKISNDVEQLLGELALHKL